MHVQSSVESGRRAEKSLAVTFFVAGSLQRIRRTAENEADEGGDGEQTFRGQVGRKREKLVILIIQSLFFLVLEMGATS